MPLIQLLCARSKLNMDEICSLKIHLWYVNKVHIFWEGHKISRNLNRRFDLYYIGQIYGGDFAKICGLLRIYELYLQKLKLQKSYIWRHAVKKGLQTLWCTVRIEFQNRAYCNYYNLTGKKPKKYPFFFGMQHCCSRIYHEPKVLVVASHNYL